MLDKAKMFLQKIQLKNEQRVIDKKFKKEGLSDEVLEKQAALNSKRCLLNIPDESDFVYENFVQ